MLGGHGLDDELRGSISSIRSNGGVAADVPIMLYTDCDRGINASGVEILCQPGPQVLHGSVRFAHRMNKAMIYASLPVRQAIFLDSDTECCNDFSELFNYCFNDKMCGIPDGRMPNADRMAIEFFGGKSVCQATFGEQYMAASNKPTAWNVGVLPISQEIGRSIGPGLIDIFNKVDKLPQHLWDLYSKHMDEQIPLNYILWKNGIKTMDLDQKFNATKKVMMRYGRPKAIFMHLRKSKHAALFGRFNEKH